MDISELTLAIVEPSAVQGKLIEAELKKLGIVNILYQACGKHALEKMQHDTPDLVVSAMYLPDMTGAELVERMREDARLEAVPFMLISSETKFSMLDPIHRPALSRSCQNLSIQTTCARRFTPLSSLLRPTKMPWQTSFWMI